MADDFLDGMTSVVTASPAFGNMLHSESGDRQTDQSGHVIVSPKGAVGAAQVMPSTGPEAARLAGEAWDPNRLRTDGDYNRKLGQAYYNQQLRTFGGDERLAAAAYNAGPGRVQAALRNGGSSGWEDHIPTETRNYLSSVFGGGARSAAGNGGTLARLGSFNDITQDQPTDVESTAMSTPHQYEVVDPATAGPAIGAQNQVVQQRAAAADSMLTDVIGQIHAIQPQREAELAASVGAKKAVGDQVESETQNLIASATPLFQRRQAIADRMVQIAGMSPIKRAIKGLFNPNYNPDYLQGQDRIYASALSTMGENYHMLTGLQDRLTSVIESRHEATDSIWRLKLDDLHEDAQLGVQAFGMSQQVLGSEMEGLQDQTSLIAAQHTARQDLMNGLAPAQVNAALSQAKASGGVAIVNGVPLRLGELQDLQDQWAEKDLALQSRKAALASGNITLAEMQEKRLVDHMNPDELATALRNGGTYQGQRLSTSLLTQAMGERQQQDDLSVRDETIRSAPGQMVQLMDQIKSTTRGSAARMLSLMGALPPEQQQYMTGVGAQLHGLAAQMADANQRGFGQRFIAEQLPKIQSLIAQQSQISQRVIQRWAGGNKDLAAVGQAWLSGQPISSDAALKGMISLARTGLPAGTTLRGPALETFRAVQQIVRTNDAPKAGQSLEEMMAQRGNTQSKDEKERALIQQVQQAVGTHYNNNTMESALHALPEIARQVQGPDGKPHPFARVRPEDFSAAIQAGDQQGYARIATDLGLSTGDQARQLFAEGPRGNLWQQVKTNKKLSDQQIASTGRTLQAFQTQAMMDALDHSPSATHDFKPSQAFADLMTNPKFQNRVGQLSSLQMNGSFGDYLASTAAGGGFQESFDQYSQNVRQAYVTRHAAQLQALSTQVQNLQGGDPFHRAGLILAGIDNVSQPEEGALLDAVRHVIGTAPPDDATTRVMRAFGSSSAPEYYGKERDAQFDQIRDTIMNRKFSDPKLEAIRKRAAASWQSMEAAVGRIQAAAR